MWTDFKETSLLTQKPFIEIITFEHKMSRNVRNVPSNMCPAKIQIAQADQNLHWAQIG